MAGFSVGYKKLFRYGDIDKIAWHGGNMVAFPVPSTDSLLALGERPFSGRPLAQT
jgi:hypothetical protein